ncbi:hypothetical protein CPB84DRAFT_1816134 [Gymnopilus junonius]|uniref:Uncharacterized protein n=1 Tax=Gymnopilus junonius TaxID=109634 RepID=A0A9P5TM16_GYMJU|nr:hypothetical protein CPB84DRAFT_1816134 [Gymnopilus junonius]
MRVKPSQVTNLVKGSKDNQGKRLAPARSAKEDAKFKCRIDQGEVRADGKYTAIVQENGNPHGPPIAKTLVDPKVDMGVDVLDRLQGVWGKAE